MYGENIDFITYSDFINKELILFSNMDNERSIPSMVDGELEHDLSISYQYDDGVYRGGIPHPSPPPRVS